MTNLEFDSLTWLDLSLAHIQKGEGDLRHSQSVELLPVSNRY
jgi:hypothetical protein